MGEPVESIELLQRKDHDTLVRLDTLFSEFVRQYGSDMKELKDGNTMKLNDHETRIRIIEKDSESIGGVRDAWQRFLLVEKKQNEFFLQWRTVIGVAVTTGSVITFVLGIVGKVLGLL